jgi:hypothetical protein
MTPSEMEVACPGCGKKFMVPLSYAGKTDCCSGCGASIKIPESVPNKPVSATQILSLVVDTPYGKFRSCMVKDPEALHMVCMATEDRLRVPLVAPALAPVLGMHPAEVGTMLRNADGIVVECPRARVLGIVQFFTEKGYSTFVVPSAVAPAPSAVRSVAPSRWSPEGLTFGMNARDAEETIPWKAVKAIGVTTLVREVTTIFGASQQDRERGSRMGLSLGNVGSTVAANVMMGPSGTRQDEVQDPAMVSLLVESEKLPAGQLECLECDERHVKYEFLGSRKAMGGTHNFTLFVHDLLEQAPHAFTTAGAQRV